METCVFEDSFSRNFDSAADFFSFLAERRNNSCWMKTPSRELRFRSVEKGTLMGNLFLQLYEAKGEGALMLDTMENSRLLMSVDGREYPVRNCAIKTILERARISGNALGKVTAEVLSRILNYCMAVATGQSLIRLADSKISAVHGGDEKDYQVLEMLPLFHAVAAFLNREFPGNQFMTAHYDHSVAMAVWELGGQSDQLLDTYRCELDQRNISCREITPALRFMTSDVGMSGANLFPVLLIGTTHRILPLGYPIRTEHRNGSDLDYFEEQLGMLFARFREALDHQIKLMDIEIRYPSAAMMGVLKRIGAPKKLSYQVQDEFLAVHGEDPCTAYELLLYISEIIFCAQCEGASAYRIAQLEEITARALHVNWSEYDRPGEFRW